MDRDIQVDDPVWTQFIQSVTVLSTARYQVTLPWKAGQKSRLMDNRSLTCGRLDRLSAQLKKSPDLEARYHVFSDMVKEGMIEEVPTEEIHSHQPIF